MFPLKSCVADASVSVQAGWRHRVGPLPFSGASVFCSGLDIVILTPIVVLTEVFCRCKKTRLCLVKWRPSSEYSVLQWSVWSDWLLLIYRACLSISRRKVHPKKQNINAYIVFKEEEEAAGALKWYELIDCVFSYCIINGLITADQIDWWLLN